jgi:hypothetical protein
MWFRELLARPWSLSSHMGSFDCARLRFANSRSAQDDRTTTARELELLLDTALGNLVAFQGEDHTRFTYHRTWETGLETEI